MRGHTPHTVAGRRSLAEFERSLFTPITQEDMIEALAAVGIDSPDGKAPACQNVSLAGTRTPSPGPDIDTRCRLTRALNGAHMIRAELDTTITHAIREYVRYEAAWTTPERRAIREGIDALEAFSRVLESIETTNRAAALEASRG